MGRRRSPVGGTAAELIAVALNGAVPFDLNRAGGWRLTVPPVQAF